MVASDSGKTPDKLLLFNFLAATRGQGVNCCIQQEGRKKSITRDKKILQIVEVLEIAE